MDIESIELEGPVAAPSFRSPPSAAADYADRAAWSERYVAWFISQTGGYGRPPADVRLTHRYEIEFQSCLLDPPRYLEMTRAELAL